jgi:hypothetical protein
VRAWSLYAHRGENPYVGHAGYDDMPGRHYSYDSRVANCRHVAVGDLSVVRGPDASHGVGFVSRIEQSEGTKTYQRCPTCNRSQLEVRKTIAPAFRCTNGHVFAQPLVSEEPVTLFRADFAPAYCEFGGLTRERLESLCLAKSRQNAIRELNLDRTLAVLREYGVFPALIRGSA